MLAGDRAREWALSRSLPAAATPSEAAAMHLTEASQRQWRKYRRIVERSTGAGGASSSRETGGSAGADGSAAEDAEEAAAARLQAKRSRPSGGSGGGGDAAQQHQQQHQQQPSTGDGCLYDTVGCVVLAPGGRVAAGVSSGGIALKTEGRVGEAAIFGAGCWAQEADPGGEPDPAGRQESSGAGQQRQQQQALPAVACSVTGVGERVMRHMLARDCCQAAAAAAAAAATEGDGSPGSAGGAAAGEVPLTDVVAQLLRRTILRGPTPHDCGLLCLRVQPLGSGNASGSSGDSGSGSGIEGGRRQQPETSGQPTEAAAGRLCVAEVAVAHSAQSMAIAHMRCDAAAAAAEAGAAAGKAAGKQAPAVPAPTVHVLRRAAGALPVQTYLHGATVRV